MMKNAVLLTGLAAGLVAAVPAPQQTGIDFAAVKAAGTPVVSGAPLAATVLSVVPTYDATSAASSAAAAAATSPVATAIAKRDTSGCAAAQRVPAGYIHPPP